MPKPKTAKKNTNKKLFVSPPRGVAPLPAFWEHTSGGAGDLVDDVQWALRQILDDQRLEGARGVDLRAASSTARQGGVHNDTNDHQRVLL